MNNRKNKNLLEHLMMILLIYLHQINFVSSVFAITSIEECFSHLKKLTLIKKVLRCEITHQ